MPSMIFKLGMVLFTVMIAAIRIYLLVEGRSLEYAPRGARAVAHQPAAAVTRLGETTSVRGAAEHLAELAVARRRPVPAFGAVTRVSVLGPRVAETVAVDVAEIPCLARRIGWWHRAQL